jgi:hypothetical protein
MKEFFLSLLILCLLIAPGCATYPEPQAVQSKPPTKTSPLFSPVLLEDKIRSLSSLLENKDVSKKDKGIISGLMTSYKEIRKSSSSELSEPDYRRIISDLLLCLSALEERYLTGTPAKSPLAFPGPVASIERGDGLQKPPSKPLVAGKAKEPLHIPDRPDPDVKKAGKTIEETINQTRELVQEKKFDEARELLFSAKSDGLPGRDAEAITQALNSIDVAEEGYIQERISIISRTKEGLERARKLMEEENFEETISSLDALGTDTGNQEVVRLKEEAIERLINRERNRAAKMFLEAKRCDDPVKREEYLNSSYNILKAIDDKYPSSPLNSRIKSHIIAVKEELDKMKEDKG